MTAEELQNQLAVLSHQLGSRLCFAVGDIHGCDQALCETLKILDVIAGKVVFLGDYINRGPSSKRTIELLIQFSRRHADALFLLGNHESMFLKSHETGRAEILFPRMALDEYQLSGGVPSAHLHFFQNLSLFHETESFIFVHGGIAGDPHLPLAQHSPQELIWTYEVSPEWEGKILVRGHQIVSSPRVHKNHISLDTGCYKERVLTIGFLDDGTGKLLGWFQVSYEGTLAGMVML